MKNFYFNVLFVCASLCPQINLAQTATAPSGSGTLGDPYQITTLNNLYWLTQNSIHWNKYYVQTADIDASSSNSWASGAGFSQIGNSTTRFTGSYDGQGHTITGIYLNRTSTNYLGMFGWVNPPAVIKRLGLINVTIIGGTVAGGLIGYISGSGTVTVQNCYTTGSVSGTYACGGLIGGADIGTISACYSSANVNIPSGTSQAGGFIGENRAQVSNSYARGNVSSTPSFTGGGGFAGSNYGGTMTNCFSTGTITGSGTKGGFVGAVALGGTSPNSVWDTQTSAMATSTQGTGKTTVQMKDINTYLTMGWDFAGETTNGTNNYWNIDGVTNSGYPVLQYFFTLAVTWNHFDAFKQNKQALLNWSTASENNTHSFQVQTSTNGSDWTVIGTVAAAGNSSTTTSYSFRHATPAAGSNYYRIGVVNLDGKMNFSDMRSLRFDDEAPGIIAYPNPVVNDKLNIRLNQLSVVTLFDNNGVQVLQQKLGPGLQQLDLRALPRGIYQLKIGNESRQVVVQ